MYSWTVCFCQVPYPVVTFSAQLGCLPLSGHLPCGHFHAQLDCLLLSGPLPCGHYQCTAGLSAFVRSPTLWLLSVHNWAVCFCQVTHPVVTFSAQLSQVNLVMTVTASVTHLPCGHSHCTAGQKNIVHQIFTHWGYLVSCCTGSWSGLCQGHSNVLIITLTHTFSTCTAVFQVIRCVAH